MTMTPTIARALTGHTPGNRWRAEGHPDPHGDHYNCERASLSKGNLTDDELANAIFMADRNSLDLIVWQTAAKDRIRWLSRKLDASAAAYLALADENERLRDFITDFIDANPEIISGRDHRDRSGQSDVPDMIEADYFWSLQKDASDLLKEPKP